MFYTKCYLFCCNIDGGGGGFNWFIKIKLVVFKLLYRVYFKSKTSFRFYGKFVNGINMLFHIYFNLERVSNQLPNSIEVFFCRYEYSKFQILVIWVWRGVLVAYFRIFPI